MLSPQLLENPARLRRQRPLRERVREVMEPYSGGPDSTRLSLIVDLLVLILILASCAIVVVELTEPGYRELFDPLEQVFTCLFIVEYLLRWYAAENRWLFPFKLLAVLDLLAILPGLLMLGSNMSLFRMARGARLLRLLRLLRLIRLLRLLRYGPLIYQGLLRTRVWLSSISYQYRLQELGKLFVWALVALVVGANVLHVTELTFAGGGAESPFAGYWRSYWSILIVLISGIEDKEPISLLGRFEVTVLLIDGLVIVGMLTGEIVSILIRRVQRAGKVALKPPRSRLERHIVVLGKSSHLDNVIRQIHLALHGQHHVLVVHPEAEQTEITDARIYRQVFALDGEPRESRVLEEADIDHAARVIVLAPEDGDGGRELGDNQALMATVAVVCRKRAIPMTVELRHERNLRYTRALPEVGFVVGRAFGERMISQAVLNPGVTDVYDHLLTFGDDSNEIYCMPVPDELVGKSFMAAQLFYLDHDDEAITPIGIDRSPPERPSSHFRLCPMAAAAGSEEQFDLVLAASDRLLVLAYQRPSAAAVEREEQWRATWLIRQ